MMPRPTNWWRRQSRPGWCWRKSAPGSNPISPDPAEGEKAFAKCCDSLRLADRVWARCCVNIAGSRGQKWDGPHPTNLDDTTFQMIVECVRKIIDTVKPHAHLLLARDDALDLSGVRGELPPTDPRHRPQAVRRASRSGEHRQLLLRSRTDRVNF